MIIDEKDIDWNTLYRLDTDIDGNKQTKLNHIVIGQFLGTINLDVERAKKQKAAFISGLFVRSDRRFLGIGSKLIGACCVIARNYGMKSIGLIVMKENEGAQEFYKKMGFEFGYQYEDESMLFIKRLEE